MNDSNESAMAENGSFFHILQKQKKNLAYDQQEFAQLR